MVCCQCLGREENSTGIQSTICAGRGYLDLVPLSKIGTHLLPSSDIMKKNRNSFACLRNADSYFAVTYCTFHIRVNAWSS
jgi:hypothetical protein